jgi:hypothetical protein
MPPLSVALHTTRFDRDARKKLTAISHSCPPLPFRLSTAPKEAEPTPDFPFKARAYGVMPHTANRFTKDSKSTMGGPPLEDQEGVFEPTERISYVVVCRLNTVKRRPVENPSDFVWLAHCTLMRKWVPTKTAI